MLHALLQLAQDHGVDGTCWRIIGIASVIVSGLATAVIVLWKENKKLVDELLVREVQSKTVLRELYERMLERMKR